MRSILLCKSPRYVFKLEQLLIDLVRFLLNNGGYTIERLIHGMTASYNAVPIWDYGALFQAFGPSFKTKHHLVKTPDELDALLTNAEFNEASYAQVSNSIVARR